MDNNKLIDNFKKAILDQDWAKCMNITESLFAQMPLDVVANLALKVVEDYAPNFQTEYPTDDWVNDRLSEIKYKLNNPITDNEDPTFPNFNKHYDAPGDNNFIGSVVELSLMLKYWNKPERAKELARDSNASIIMANSLRNWGKTNPELWNRLMNPNNDSDRLILSTHFKTDPVVLDNQFEAWLSLANDIEKWIRQGQS